MIQDQRFGPRGPYARPYGDLSRLFRRSLTSLLIFSTLSPASPIPRSLSDRHTFSKIDLGSVAAATVTRSALGKRKREAAAISNRRCRTDSVLNSCLGPLSPVFEEERERNGSFPLSSHSSLLLCSFSSFSYLYQRHLSLSLSLGLSTCSSIPSTMLLVFHSTYLSLDPLLHRL